MTDQDLNVKSPPLVDIALASGCVSLVVAKAWLATRTNINWDEFYFLSHVHALIRGDLSIGLQTAFAHLFTWLPGVANSEIDQIVVARLAMTVLLALGAWLVYEFVASRHSRTDALLATLAFLALLPTLRHGASFRYDSILLPLQMAALLLVATPGRQATGRMMSVGALLGLAITVSIKAALVAPLVATLAWIRVRNHPTSPNVALRTWCVEMAVAGGCAAAIGALLLGTHWLAIDGAHAASSSTQQAADAWRWTIKDTPLFPQLHVLQEVVGADPFTWSMIALGTAFATFRRDWLSLACVLAILPVVFYRNAFPYFYVLMSAPLAALFAAATAQLRVLATRRGSARAAAWATGGLAAAVALQAAPHLAILVTPRQQEQRSLVAAAHQIFPRPVAYIDRCGMLPSFSKTNFFMSSWGIQKYLAEGRPFMPAAVETQRPPLLVANRRELVAGSAAFGFLHSEDRRLIECCYIAYWGPIHVAGARAKLTGNAIQRVRLPFGGSYRLDSPVPVQVDGQPRRPGDLIEVADGRRELAIAGSAPDGPPVIVRFLWAEARPAPTTAPPPIDLLFDPL